ncbi:MAG: hypothetical protein WA061_05205 [Microgenomates group bacterium]
MRILDLYERTKATAVIVIPISTLLFTVTQIQDLEKLSFIPLDKSILFNFATLFVGLLVLVFIMETLFIVFGRFKLLNTILGFILNIIGWVISFITNAWIFLLKPFIAPVIKEILKESAFISKIYYLRNRYLGRVDDDVFIPEIYCTKKLTILCRPTKAFPRWRFGIKFSNNDAFPSARFDLEHYLFHLTKDLESNNLYFHFYQDTLTHNYKKLIDNYSHDPIKIVITTSKETQIDVYSFQNKLLNSVKTKFFDKLQLFAWADGQQDFELEVKITEY